MFFKTIEDETYSDISIPSIFFDMFMPIASGDQVKIYLLAYREAYFCNGLKSGDLTNEVIASTLGISDKDVVEAWRFWVSHQNLPYRWQDAYRIFGYKGRPYEVPNKG